MRFALRGKVLCDVTTKMHAVAGGEVAQDFSNARRVTIEVKGQHEVTFVTSNGHLTARLMLTPSEDPLLKAGGTGKVTIDSGVLKKLANTIGGGQAADHIVDLFIEGDDLVLADTLTAKRGQLPHLNSHHQFAAEALKGETYSIDAGIFRRGISAVSRYTSTYSYKVRYQMVCIHLAGLQTRFVCGSGAFFAIATYSSDGRFCQKQRETKFILPARQAEIISSLIADAQRVDFTNASRGRCHILPDTNIDMVLDRIPKLDYIPYEQNGYRHGEARCLVDVKRKDLDAALRHIEATRDAEVEKEGVFHSLVFDTSATSTELCVEDGRFQCSTPLPAQSYFLGGALRFRGEYPWAHLRDLARAEHGKHIRFYFIDEHGIAIADIGNLCQSEDPLTPPDFVPEVNNSTLRFFFASVHRG